MRDFDLLFFMRGSAWLLYRLAMWPFRAFLNDMRIRKAVRRFDAVMSNPFAPVTAVWLSARSVHWAYNYAMAPRRWQMDSHRAARVATEIKRQTGNRILLWVLFPELGP